MRKGEADILARFLKRDQVLDAHHSTAMSRL